MTAFGAPSVLVVDDDEIARMLARRFLGEAGFDVSEAVDGESALEQLAQETILGPVGFRDDAVELSQLLGARLMAFQTFLPLQVVIQTARWSSHHLPP